MIPLDSLLQGIVEDVNDPLDQGRVRVRWVGIHTSNLSILPVAMLPWSNLMGSVYSASISGVGTSPVGLVCGTMVLGIPLDDGKQEFLVIGTIGGNRQIYINSSYGFNDPNGEYPIPGVLGDISKLAGGNADSGTVGNLNNETISSSIPGSKDPTIEDKILDPDAYKDTPWMPIAIGELGVNETDNPEKIKEYHSVGGGYMQEPTVSWCASFIGWCLNGADIKGTRSAASRSYLNYGESVGTEDVPYGSIAVFGVPNSGKGHVAFVVEDKGTSLVCIGGNQSDKSNRSGGIVSKTNIPKTSKSLVLLNCVRPTNLQGK